MEHCHLLKPLALSWTLLPAITPTLYQKTVTTRPLNSHSAIGWCSSGLFPLNNCAQRPLVGLSATSPQSGGPQMESKIRGRTGLAWVSWGLREQVGDCVLWASRVLTRATHWPGPGLEVVVTLSPIPTSVI